MSKTRRDPDVNVRERNPLLSLLLSGLVLLLHVDCPLGAPSRKLATPSLPLSSHRQIGRLENEFLFPREEEEKFYLFCLFVVKKETLR